VGHGPGRPCPGRRILTNLGTRSIISSLTERFTGPAGVAVGQYLWCWERDGLVLIHLKAWAPARRRLASILHVAGCVLLVGALIGCQGNGRQPTPTTAVAPAATAVPSPTASPTATSTATATLTPTPTATATSTPTPTPLPEARLLSPMTHEYQGWNNCGAVSAEMVLSYYGIERGQYEIAAVLRPYRDDKHVGTDEMLEYLRAAGLEGRVLVNGGAERLQAFVASGIPVIIRTILQPGDDIGHYVVIRGYDRAAQTLIANDSYYGPEHVISEQALEAIWAPFNHSYIPIYRPAQAEEVCDILGEDCNEQAMYRRAEEAARAWTERTPGDAYAWYCLGDDLLALGQPDLVPEAVILRREPQREVHDRERREDPHRDDQRHPPEPLDPGPSGGDPAALGRGPVATGCRPDARRSPRLVPGPRHFPRVVRHHVHAAPLCRSRWSRPIRRTAHRMLTKLPRPENRNYRGGRPTIREGALQKNNVDVAERTRLACLSEMAFAISPPYEL